LPKFTWGATALTLDALNELDQAAFTRAIGGVFEHSPWVAERVWSQRPFCDIDSLHLAMACQVEHASPDEQLTLLLAHPDLGTRTQLSTASASEQTGAGLHQLTEEEGARLTRLNESYKQKFGFPFLLAVKGSTKHEILRALEQRLPSTHEMEFAEALRQVYRIAAFRLHDVLGQES
jgi:OHCU decarboxylase